VQTFHADVLTQMAAKGWVRVFLLEVKGRVIAALYGFSTGKTFSFYQSGMDPAWAHLSVGLVLMGCSMEHAIRSGIGTFDLLRGNEDYKFQWATGVHHTQTVCFFDGRAKSQWGLAQVRIRKQGKQIKLLLRRTAAVRWLYAHVVRWSEQMKHLVRRQVVAEQGHQDSGKQD
jgi:CelD/BcsL family acetyltransferase involved in cellulose biosynthesis